MSAIDNAITDEDLYGYTASPFQQRYFPTYSLLLNPIYNRRKSGTAGISTWLNHLPSGSIRF